MAWYTKPFADTEPRVQRLCEGSYPERGMGGRKTIVGGELCVIDRQFQRSQKTK